MDEQGTIRERIARIELTQETINRERQEIRQSVDELTMEIRQQFEGINGNPGITMRLDRLEQTEKTRAKWFWLTITSSVGAFATVIIERIFHK